MIYVENQDIVVKQLIFVVYAKKLLNFSKILNQKEGNYKNHEENTYPLDAFVVL